MTSDLTEDNLRAIATPASTVALSVAPLVSFTPVNLDNIPNNSMYFDGIDFQCLYDFQKPFFDL